MAKKLTVNIPDEAGKTAVTILGKHILFVTIEQDQDARSPREHDNVGHMVCWHRRYDLGDEQRKDAPEDFYLELAQEFRPGLGDYLDNAFFNSIVTADPVDGDTTRLFREQWAEFKRRRHEEIMKIVNWRYLLLPLGLIDHSGISMYIGSGAHACDPGGWDSGQVGWIYCTKKKAREEWGRRKDYLARARKCMESEVEEYDKYLQGDVWGFVIEAFKLRHDQDDKTIVLDEREDYRRATPVEEDSCWGHIGWEYAVEATTEAAASVVGALGKRKKAA
jgi:hypothetical protein